MLTRSSMNVVPEYEFPIRVGYPQSFREKCLEIGAFTPGGRTRRPYGSTKQLLCLIPFPL